MTMRIVLFCIILFLFSFPLSAGSPAARFELASVPLVSQAASRLDNSIAPRFRDTAAAVTLILTMGATRVGMDLTRPAEIHFHSFGEQPVLRIFAHALPGVKEPQNHVKLWGLRFHAVRKDGLIALDSEGLTEPFPAAAPGKNLQKGELLRGTVQADAVRRNFRFGSFNTKNRSAHLLLSGLDELLAEIEELSVVFAADENVLQVDLTISPQKESALLCWMKKPLPVQGRIETFAGAQTLSILRLHPTDTLKKYGKAYLMQDSANALPESLPAAVNGFAAMAIRNSGKNSSVRLAVGIDPAQSAAVRKEIGKLDYTPYPDWFQLRRRPPLFCSGNPDRVIFCGMDSLDRSTLENLLRPLAYRGTVPDRPFFCIDLKHPERPLAELRFEKDAMHLILRAPDSWFSDCRPLLEKPLLLSDRRKKD